MTMDPTHRWNEGPGSVPPDGAFGGPAGPGDADRAAAEAEGPELRDLLARRSRLLAHRPGLVGRIDAASRGALQPRSLRLPAARGRWTWSRSAVAALAASIALALLLWPQAPQLPTPSAPDSQPAVAVIPAAALDGPPTDAEPMLVALISDSDLVADGTNLGPAGANSLDLLRARDASFRKLAGEVQLIALATRRTP